MEDNESVDQGVETNESSVVEESTSPVESSEAEVQANAEDSTPEKQEEKPAPFHEHPRFKELIEQNRSMKEQEALRGQVLDNLQRELASLREQVKPKSEPKKDPFLAELEKIDPTYAKSLESVYGKAAKVEAIEQRLAQYEQEQRSKEVYSEFNQLLASNKVTDALDKKLYEDVLTAKVYQLRGQGKQVSIADIPRLFNEFHSEYTKAMEERNRKNLAGYVQDKTKDKTPRSTTGGAATAPTAKKLKASDISGQAKWLADQIRSMKKEH